MANEGTEQQDRKLRAYNDEHFWAKHLLADLWRTARGAGARPGTEAPDFDLESTEGDRVRLSGLRDRPVRSHFGCGT